MQKNQMFMIYYDHLDKEEFQDRKTQHTINKTNFLLTSHFQIREDGRLEEEAEILFLYNELSPHDVLNIIMDDATKIKVLMIYYDHWGKDELRTRKTVHGINKTLSLLRDRFHTKDYTLLDGLMRMFHYLEHEDKVFLWADFANIFLQMKGCFDLLSPNDPYEEEEILFERKILLETNLNLHNEDTSDMIYDDEFGYENVLSVDAIVALM